MRRLTSIMITFIQCSITFVAMLSVYMVFVVLDYEGGVEGFMGTALLQPIMATVISIFTIVFCLIIGLPIRLSKRINRWWIDHFALAMLGAIAGFVILALSMLPTLRETVAIPPDATKEVPNMVLAPAGWFLTAFSLSHMFPSANVIVRLEEILSKLFPLGNHSHER